ncbi:AT-rich interactive domain-containing protein 3A isoform X3 [Chiloscyllium punctatum]|uniref:AT-rich interactive domain-containing protein 3A isoform X3 n=1 Tax=Chiloscyllium punctatum TaxID=137246 RepID=UPI003B637A6B
MKLQAVMENLQRQQRARLELEARQQQNEQHHQQQPQSSRARLQLQAQQQQQQQQQQQIQMEQREPRRLTAEFSNDNKILVIAQQSIAAQQTAALAAMRAAAAAAGADVSAQRVLDEGDEEELGMERGDSPRLSETSEALSGGDEMDRGEEEEETAEPRYPDPLGSEEDMAAEEEEEFEDEMAEEGGSGVKERGMHHSGEVHRLPGQRRPITGLPCQPHPQMQQVQDQAEWTYEEQFKQLYELDNDPRRKEFLDDLFSFMQKRGTPVNRIPIMAKQVLDLYMLYALVTEKGGLVEVINKKLWREITKGLNLPTSITSAAFTLRTQYMKYLYPYECEKRGLSSPNELQVAIDSNRREGRRHGFGSSLYSYSPSGTSSVLSSPKLQVPTLNLATTNGSPINQLVKIKKADRQESALNLTTNGMSSISMSVEINGVVYTGVLFGQGPGISGASSIKGNNKNNNSQGTPSLPVPRTPTSSSSHTSNNSSP